MMNNVYESPKTSLKLTDEPRPISAVLMVLLANLLLSIIVWLLATLLFAFLVIQFDINLAGYDTYAEVGFILIWTLWGMLGVWTGRVLYRKAAKYFKSLALLLELVFATLYLVTLFTAITPSSFVIIGYIIFGLVLHPLGVLIGAKGMAKVG